MAAGIYFSVWALSVGVYMVIYLLGKCSGLTFLGFPSKAAPAQIGAAFPQIGGGFMDKVAANITDIQFLVHAMVFSVAVPGVLLLASETGGEGFEDASGENKSTVQRAVDAITSASSKAASRVASLF